MCSTSNQQWNQCGGNDHSKDNHDRIRQRMQREIVSAIRKPTKCIKVFCQKGWRWTGKPSKETFSFILMIFVKIFTTFVYDFKRVRTLHNRGVHSDAYVS